MKECKLKKKKMNAQTNCGPTRLEHTGYILIRNVNFLIKYLNMLHSLIKVKSELQLCIQN